MNDLRVPHVVATKHILRYIKDTTDFGLSIPRETNLDGIVLEDWFDLEWCRDNWREKTLLAIYLSI